MSDALIGFSGFVGQTLLRQRPFEALFRSTDIDSIRGRTFDTIVCSGAPAQKWLANKDPVKDRANIATLISALEDVRCRRMILISTVDVFGEPNQVTESAAVAVAGLHPYGLHRYELENFVRRRFNEHYVLRLAGLVGPDLRKNVLYDFAHDNATHTIDHRSVFQFYPMVNLWRDIQIAIENDLKTVHLTAAPLQVAQIAREAFGMEFINCTQGGPVQYDFRTQFAAQFGGSGAYQYDERESLMAIRAYRQGVLLARKAQDNRA